MALKEKVVEFKLSEKMTLPELVRKGYQRKEIVALFEKLQEEGLGMYQPGERGKGKCANFEMYLEYPESFVMKFEVERLHTDYAGKPGVAEKLPDYTPVSPNGDMKLSGGENGQLVMAPLSPPNPNQLGIPCASVTASKYTITIDEDRLRLAKTDEGANSIDDALCDIWYLIDKRVRAKPGANMTRLQEVASNLRGIGWYKLDPPPSSPVNDESNNPNS